MATLLDLERRGDVAKLDAALAPAQQELRRVYVRPRVQTWMENILPRLESALGLEVSPIEQLDAFLETYCSGATMTYERQFKPLRHIDAGVWELKMPDLRMFGWFSMRDWFVCTDCDC